jgi:cbb3-type cytochrome oxidase subunit 3
MGLEYSVAKNKNWYFVAIAIILLIIIFLYYRNANKENYTNPEDRDDARTLLTPLPYRCPYS